MTREEAIRILDPETTGEALAEIEYYNGFNGRNAAVQAVSDACVLAVAALWEQEQRRWIPVMERLPEEGDYALCVLKGFNYGGKIQVCKFVPADKFKDKPYFEHFRNGFPSVTHWMPLPQPPKGE